MRNIEDPLTSPHKARTTAFFVFLPIVLGLIIGFLLVNNHRLLQMQVTINQMHFHTCRLEAKLDYQTTPDCPPIEDPILQGDDK